MSVGFLSIQRMVLEFWGYSRFTSRPLVAAPDGKWCCDSKVWKNVLSSAPDNIRAAQYVKRTPAFVTGCDCSDLAQPLAA